MTGLSNLRTAYVEIVDKTILLLPEYELTDFPPKGALTRAVAEERILESDADITIAGFVETAEGKMYSSCIVSDGKYIYIIRKNKPYTSEIEIISESFDIPPIMRLSIGKSVVLICSDARLYGEDNAFIQEWKIAGVEVAFLISAWKHNFSKAVEVMTQLAESVGVSHCYIMDRFNGLVKIK